MFFFGDIFYIIGFFQIAGMSLYFLEILEKLAGEIIRDVPDIVSVTYT